MKLSFSLSLLLVVMSLQAINSNSIEEPESEEITDAGTYVDYLLATHPELIEDRNRSYLHLGYDEAIVKVGHSDTEPEAFFRFYNNDKKEPGDQVELEIDKGSVKECKECLENSDK